MTKEIKAVEKRISFAEDRFKKGIGENAMKKLKHDMSEDLSKMLVKDLRDYVDRSVDPFTD